MTITANQLEKVNAVEGLKVEFKTSRSTRWDEDERKAGLEG